MFRNCDFFILNTYHAYGEFSKGQTGDILFYVLLKKDPLENCPLNRFSRKNKKNVSKCHLQKLLPSMVLSFRLANRNAMENPES